MARAISRRGEHDRPSFERFAVKHIFKTSQCDVLNGVNYSYACKFKPQFVC